MTLLFPQVDACEEVCSLLLLCSLGPKYMDIPGVNARGSSNLAVWSLQWAIYYTVKQHLETVLYKPLCHHGFKVSSTVYQVECGCWPSLSATVVPLHLTQFAVPFVQIVTTVCLQGTWIYMIFLWHVQCMVHGSQALGWFNPLLFEPVGMYPLPNPFPASPPPPPHLTEESWCTQLPIRTLGWCDMLSRNKTPWVCREPSSSEPAVLSRARFASCTGQIHDTACSTAHVHLYPV